MNGTEVLPFAPVGSLIIDDPALAEWTHQQLTPEHMLKALLEDEEGMAANLISAAGGNLISVNDDAGGNPIQVTLTATGGTVTRYNPPY